MAERPLTVSAVANRYGVTTRTVYGWIKDNKLPAFRVGGRGSFRILPESIAALECPAESSNGPITGSAAAANGITLTGPTPPPARDDPFQRGRQSAMPPRYGAING